MAFSPLEDHVQPPRLSVTKLRREYPAGEGTLVVLKDIDLTIEPGEMVAIVGQSGSGKSTLMNILGCLDRPSAGTYTVGGKATSNMAPDELAELRREHFGFIFQRYHLLGDLTAHGNVEVPAIYSGVPRDKRRERAKELLKRLGLEGRMDHRPGQLSGGQQQRVSIARSLMNGGEIVLADEPTGALDTASGEEVMRILKGLHRDGHTVIIVTHDMHVAEHCERVIEIRDGNIIADRPGRGEGEVSEQSLPPVTSKGNNGVGEIGDSFREALAMALLAMNAHRMRTFLTMLGIIIGIASVVCVVALGEGSRQAVLKQIASIGTNTLQIQPGNGFGDRRAGAIRTLVVADAKAMAKLPYVDSVTPTVSTNQTVRYGSISASATINGVGEQYARVRGLQLDEGAFFNEDDVNTYQQNAIIDQNTLKTFFPDGGDPLGKIIILGSVPVRVVGVASATGGNGGGFGGNDQLNIYMPYTSVNARMLGTSVLRSLTIRVKDDTDSETAAAGVTALLTARHGVQDFFVLNTDQIRQTITATTTTLTILISAIAIISLVVGGIGVMNIMLVSVTERTQEIGVRMAVGARQRDIMQQFLIESVLVCLMGGILGILTALGFGALFAVVAKDFTMIYSLSSIIAAFLCSTLIGVIFGFLPARNAARLDPVAALARD
jgi:macrolide transport system ATP-binding/permease protein